MAQMKNVLISNASSNNTSFSLLDNDSNNIDVSFDNSSTFITETEK